MQGFLLDTAPLRVSAGFRRLWAGQAVSFVGTMVTTAALPFQVFHQTGSSLAVGLLGVAQLGPLVASSVLGGTIADGLDKRRVLILATAASLACSAGLMANALLPRPALWALYLLGAASSGLFGMTQTVVRSMLPLLLDETLRPAGFALQSTYTSFGMMGGPVIAGALIGGFGVRTAYAADAASYLVALGVFFGLKPFPVVPGAPRASVASLVEGLRFLRGSIVMSIFGIDLLAMIFGMPRALFPALTQRLGGGAALYGLLLGSVAAGAFVASLVSGWTRRVRRQGRAVLVAVAAWGLAIAAVGVVRDAAVVLVLLAVAGGADMVSAVFRSSIAADVTPDSHRGRVSGVELAVYAGGPVLGDVESGVVGGLAGVPVAIVSGGLACVAAAVAFGAFVPRLGRYVAAWSRPPAAAAAP
jgi:MFS family permease